MSKPFLVTEDFTKDFNEIVAGFKRDAVLIGIPQVETSRTASPEDNEDGVTQPINNATLLAINEFGSEEAHIPPRPVMSIGIKNAQADIAEQFKKAAQQALSKGLSVLGIYYNRAGIIASNSVKKAINSQEGIESPAPSTIAARKARGFKGIKALIVTGQMRNAITYVINKGGF